MHLFAESYKVTLPVFEGPLDLLLHLIRKNDLAIADIPISYLLEQYHEYLALMEELNIDLAGEFIFMAAELAHIKSKTLLPNPADEEEEGEDPRADLARRLLEYQRFKDAAQSLSGRPLLGREVFIRAPEREEDPEEGMLQADAFKLLSAFGEVLKRLKPEKYHQVMVERLSVTERIYELLEVLKNQESVTFDSFFEGEVTRARCIVTFLAVLEMVRLKLIQVYQTDLSAPLRISRIEGKEEKSDVPLGSEFDRKEGVSEESESKT